MTGRVYPFKAVVPPGARPGSPASANRASEGTRRSIISDFEAERLASARDHLLAANLDVRAITAARAGSEPVDCLACLRDNEIERRSTYQKIADALGSQRALDFYAGAFCGSIGFAALCVLWARIVL